MPFAPVPVTTEDLVTYLSDKVGTEVNTKQLFEASEHFKCSLATVKKRLKTYKQGIGKWNLTVQEKLEQTFQAPSAIPAIEQNLVPDKDQTLFLSVTSLMLRRLFSQGCSILHSLLDFLVMVKHSL